MAAALQITCISRHFGRVRALDGVTLALEEGQITAVLGPAGSGKTNLINIIAGFDRGYRGAVTMGRAPMDDVPAHKRGFGVVQQGDAFFPTLNLRENIALPLKLRGIARLAREKLVDTAIDLAELGAAALLLPAQASAGEWQRAALARAAVHEPRVLLLDEPCADQHGHARAAMLGAIARLHRVLGATTLIVTRDDAAALALADRLAVLREGRIIAAGTPEDLYNRPETAAVAAMIGQSSRFAGTIVDVDDDTVRIKLDCGPEVDGAAYSGAQAGARCRLFIRPERVAVAATTAAEMSESAVDATVIEARFCGEHNMMRLLIGSGAELVASRPAAAGMRGFKPGNAAAVAWQPHHTLVFPG